MRDRETNEAIQGIELHTLELRAQRTTIEHELAKRHDEAMYKLKQHYRTEQDKLMNHGKEIL